MFSIPRLSSGLIFQLVFASTFLFFLGCEQPTQINPQPKETTSSNLPKDTVSIPSPITFASAVDASIQNLASTSSAIATTDEVEEYPERETMHSFGLKLEKLYLKYKSIPVNTDVSALINLDQELSDLFKSVHEVESEPRGLWEARYSEIGVEIEGIYGLGYYSWVLQLEAHKRNPNSPYREDTFYAKSMTSTHDDEGRYRLEPLYQYLREYPSGKHVTAVHSRLGEIYKNLYRLLWELTKDDFRLALGNNCYASLISTAPLTEQMNAARKAALDNYALALKKQKNDAQYRDVLRQRMLAEIEQLNKPLVSGKIPSCIPDEDEEAD